MPSLRRRQPEEGIVLARCRALAMKVLDGLNLKAKGHRSAHLEACHGKPLKIIAANGGRMDRSSLKGENWRCHGYNAELDKYEDMVAAGIIDLTKVTRFA